MSYRWCVGKGNLCCMLGFVVGGQGHPESVERCGL